MFVALTQQEYNTLSSDDGTLAVVEHTHHNTGFTLWNCSFHDAITYMLWCMLAGVTAYTPVIYMLAHVCPGPTKGDDGHVPLFGPWVQSWVCIADVSA